METRIYYVKCFNNDDTDLDESFFIEASSPARAHILAEEQLEYTEDFSLSVFLIPILPLGIERKLEYADDPLEGAQHVVDSRSNLLQIVHPRSSLAEPDAVPP